MAYKYIANDFIYSNGDGTTTAFEPLKYGEVTGLTGDALTAYEAKFTSITSAIQTLVDAGTLTITDSPADSPVSYKLYTFTTDPVPAETWFDDIFDADEAMMAAMNEIIDDVNVTTTARYWLERS